jgi:hypothetical protein
VSPSGTWVALVRWNNGSGQWPAITLIGADGEQRRLEFPWSVGPVAVLDDGRVLLTAWGNGSYLVRDDLATAEKLSDRTVRAVTNDAVIFAGCEGLTRCGAFAASRQRPDERVLVFADVFVDRVALSPGGDRAVAIGYEPASFDSQPQSFAIDLTKGDAAVLPEPGDAFVGLLPAWDPFGVVVAWPTRDGVGFHNVVTGQTVNIVLADGGPASIALIDTD